MKRRARENLNKTFTGLVGWLFADLLLALAILFLIANTIPPPRPPENSKLKATATPTAVAPPSLEQTWHSFTITIDPQKLLSHDADERNAVIQQVIAQGFLNNRSAGLMVVYGGALTNSNIRAAQNIATAIYDIILNDLKKKDARFVRVATYLPLYFLGVAATEVNIDVFLFTH